MKRSTQCLARIILLLSIATLAACSGSSRFKGQTFRAADNREAIRFTSSHELELQSRGTNLICQYTIEGDTVRITANVLGTTQAIYYTITPDGLRSPEGVILLSADGYAAAMERERQHQEQLRLAAEAQKRERARIAEVRAKSREKHKVAAEFKLKPMVYTGGIASVDALTITDVSLIAHQPQDVFNREDRLIFMYFADLTKIEDVKADYRRFLFYVFDETNGNQHRIDVFADSRTEANTIRDACIASYEDWRKEYPDAARIKEKLSSSLAASDTLSQLIVGKWQGGHLHTLYYAQDGSYFVDPDDSAKEPNGHWHIEDDKLNVTFSNGQILSTKIISLTQDELVLERKGGEERMPRIK